MLPPALVLPHTPADPVSISTFRMIEVSCCKTVNLVNEIQIRQSGNRLTSKGTGVDPSRGVEAMTPKLKCDVSPGKAKSERVAEAKRRVDTKHSPLALDAIGSCHSSDNTMRMCAVKDNRADRESEQENFGEHCR